MQDANASHEFSNLDCAVILVAKEQILLNSMEGKTLGVQLKGFLYSSDGTE